MAYNAEMWKVQNKYDLERELNKCKNLLITNPYGIDRDKIIKCIKDYEDCLKKNYSEPDPQKIVKSDLSKIIKDSTLIKKKKTSISSTMKKLVWNTNIGEEMGKAKCKCCNSTDITQMSFHCGHIIAEANGGKTIVSNLKPICQNCNSSMGTKNMNNFMESFR
jgi:hypothetical protein